MTSIKRIIMLNCIKYANENKLFDKLNMYIEHYQVGIAVDVENAVWSLLELI